MLFKALPCDVRLPLQAGVVLRNRKVQLGEKVSYRKEKRRYGSAKHKLLGLMRGGGVRCNSLMQKMSVQMVKWFCLPLGSIN